MIATHITTAVRELTRNAGRSILTMLGVIIGIGSVIFIMTVGESARQFLISQISQFGTNVLEVSALGEIGPFSETEGTAFTFTLDDLEQLEESPLLPEMTGMAGMYGVRSVLEYGEERQSVGLFGVTDRFFSINHLNMLAGRVIDRSDIENRKPVILIGEQLSNDVFDGAEQAVGKQVKIDGTTMDIIGVLEDPPINIGLFGALLYTPISTTYEAFADPSSEGDLTVLMAEFGPETDVPSFKQRFTDELNRIKNVPEGEELFFIADRDQFLTIFRRILLGIQAFISAVAGISLLVGGIGIMNIMLVSVKERTKEIGLRKAIGARHQSIQAQFLIEAIVLTTIGGVIGVLLGIALSLLAVIGANAAQPYWDVQFVFVPSALLLACGVSVVVGVIFGFYPAWKAAKLPAIEALRYE